MSPSEKEAYDDLYAWMVESGLQIDEHPSIDHIKQALDAARNNGEAWQIEHWNVQEQPLPGLQQEHQVKA